MSGKQFFSYLNQLFRERDAVADVDGHFVVGSIDLDFESNRGSVAGSSKSPVTFI